MTSVCQQQQKKNKERKISQNNCIFNNKNWKQCINKMNFLDCDEQLTATPRLFHMTSVLGNFEVAEVVSDQLRHTIW